MVNLIHFKKVVDKEHLEYVLLQNGMELKKRSIDAMFVELRDQNPGKLAELYEQYQFAGRTAVNIFEAVGYPVSQMNKQSFIASMCGAFSIAENSVGTVLQPDYQSEPNTPKINLITEREDGFLIQFVEGKERLSWNDYDTIKIIEPSYETAIIRLTQPVYLELRCPYFSRNKYLRIFESLLPAGTGKIDWIPLTKVTEQEAESIALSLKAGLTEAELAGEGDIGRIVISASEDCDDLRNTDEYARRAHGLPYFSQCLNVAFTHKDGYRTNFVLRINIGGGFQFLSKVTEGIIDTVIEVFLNVRYLKKTAVGQ